MNAGEKAEFERSKRIVAERQGWHCFHCGVNTHGDAWPGHSTHHRQSRRFHDHKPANLVRLCGTGSTGCHWWAHEHQAEAERLGLIVPGWTDPRTVPIRDWRGDWWWLLDDGTARRLTQAEIIEHQIGTTEGEDDERS